jgi:hypothetical protein
MKKRWIAILCATLALITLTSCASCEGNPNNTTGTTTTTEPEKPGRPEGYKNPYFYIWKTGKTDEGTYKLFTIKANAMPGEYVDLLASDFKMVGPDGTEYAAAGFVASVSYTYDDEGNPISDYDIVQSVFYDDGERSIIYVVFPDHIENGKLYHKGEKVLDRTAEFEHLENGEDVFE